MVDTEKKKIKLETGLLPEVEKEADEVLYHAPVTKTRVELLVICNKEPP